MRKCALHESQGVALGIGWSVCIRDTDGGYGCALKERRIVRARVGEETEGMEGMEGVEEVCGVWCVVCGVWCVVVLCAS
jgi:hypothetical protein